MKKITKACQEAIEYCIDCGMLENEHEYRELFKKDEVVNYLSDILVEYPKLPLPMFTLLVRTYIEAYLRGGYTLLLQDNAFSYFLTHLENSQRAKAPSNPNAPSEDIIEDVCETLLGHLKFEPIDEKTN